MTMYKITEEQRKLLLEAMKRYTIFLRSNPRCGWNIKNLQQALVGHGSNSEYECVREAYMDCRTLPIKKAPRIKKWWALNKNGAEIVLAWHNQGITFDGTEEPNKMPELTG